MRGCSPGRSFRNGGGVDRVSAASCNLSSRSRMALDLGYRVYWCHFGGTHGPTRVARQKMRSTLRTPDLLRVDASGHCRSCLYGVRATTLVAAPPHLAATGVRLKMRRGNFWYRDCRLDC